ncbi:MAG TPA: TIGR04255 family protein [Clostridia bacterium]|nr:TIGR04255 family protein [Clostridia bacterium]
MKSNNPFAGPEPQEVYLPDAPLVKVLCRIRFPTIASIDKKEFIALFQEAIRHNYPKHIKVTTPRFSSRLKSATAFWT